MNELFLIIINMSISASWLILAVLILRLVLKKAPKWVSVLLWGIVAVRLLCPFSIESSVSLVPQFIGNGELVSELMDDYIGEVSIIHDNSIYYDAAVTAGREPISDGEGGYYVVTKYDQLGEPSTVENTVMPVLTIVWTIVMIFLALHIAISYWRLRCKVDTAVLYRDNIFQSENVSSPFVLGIIKPRIYLPFKLNGQELEHVVAHEQAHIRRKDHWWKPLGFLLLTIHWFNPLMWLSFVILCRDIELACDEKVIKELGNEQRADYTQALVACSVNRRLIAACPLAFGEVSVKERVKSVMNYKRPAFWIIVASVIACAIVALCFLTNPKQNSFDIKIVIPAGSQESFVYSDEEISPTKNQIIVTSGDNLGDIEVILKPVEVRQENIYEPTYLTPGIPVKMDAEKGAWFKIGVNMQNTTNEDIIVYVGVVNVEVRITSVDENELNQPHREDNTDASEADRNEFLDDIAYHLELSTLGKEFRDMEDSRKEGILDEYKYGQLLNGYSLLARESIDGTAMYIVGLYNGNYEDSPLNMMYSMEVGEGDREYQMLYTQEEEEAVNENLAASEDGYVIQDSRISIYGENGVILIQPENVKENLGNVLSRYLSTQQGRTYIQDAVSRGVSINIPNEPYLSVYLISDQFGEIVENIPLTDAEAKAMLEEERVALTEGYGFGAMLHIDGRMEFFSEYKGVPQTALNLAVEKCGYKFATPGDITTPILEACLDCDWLDTPIYADENSLERLKEILINAEFDYVGNCGYGAKLTLTLTDGEKLTMFKGTDSCDTMVFGSYGGYYIGDKENTEFWEIFGLDVETKELLGENTRLEEVMIRILTNQGLDNVLDFEDGSEYPQEDKVILLCTSEGGKYEAFGFVSPEYGTAGILLNNIIDGEDNWNYYYETWSYGDVKPTLQEQGEYGVIFTFTQGNGDEREIYFDTYDTGTMSARE